MESPDVYQLTRIRWQLFGTLTFSSERCPERVRLGMWFAMCRKTAASFRLYFPRMLWCLRQEQGAVGGRRHFHYLLAGLPAKAVTISTCFAEMASWENLGGGMARVRVFNPTLNGVGYVSECLGMAGADSYESAKFGWSSAGLMLSKGAEAMLRRVIREERRCVERLDKRRFESVSQAKSTVVGSSVLLDPRSCGSSPAFE